MYDFIEGTLERLDKDMLTVKTTSGIGFRLSIGKNSPLRAIAKNGFLRVWAELIVREDKQELFGFASLEERSLFCLLQEVSGVGPKLAMAISSGLDQKALIRAIASQESEALREIPGVGKKTAERVVLELHDKIMKVLPEEMSSPLHTGDKAIVSQAFSALKTLGFTEEEAKSRIKKGLSKGLSFQSPEELIQQALQSP